MSLISILFTYILSVTTFLILPGPVNLFVANSTLKYGIKGTLLTILGANLASLVLIAIAGFLIVSADSINPIILDLLTLLGGAFLLYYGTMQILGSLKQKAIGDHESTTASFSHEREGYLAIKLVSQAFAIGISNPKDVIFFIAFFPPFILQMSFSIPYSLLILTIIWCVLDYTLLFSYGILTKRFIKGRFKQVFSFICGLLFLGVGLYAIYLVSAILMVEM